ncbi:hypothetical protein TorRG33x02_173220 [Trema orientale]|uniref:Uncharacterized protein n=1 Tax=Trema orientale TaxID=63057 RepID=A0A2P5EMZ3_TREOI|nr:hypothetical protein TorRG33x02_173220 [Trema orientale]
MIADHGRSDFRAIPIESNKQISRKRPLLYISASMNMLLSTKHAAALISPNNQQGLFTEYASTVLQKLLHVPKLNNNGDLELTSLDDLRVPLLAGNVRKWAANLSSIDVDQTIPLAGGEMPKGQGRVSGQHCS